MPHFVYLMVRCFVSTVADRLCFRRLIDLSSLFVKLSDDNTVISHEAAVEHQAKHNAPWAELKAGISWKEK